MCGVKAMTYAANGDASASSVIRLVSRRLLQARRTDCRRHDRLVPCRPAAGGCAPRARPWLRIRTTFGPARPSIRADRRGGHLASCSTCLISWRLADGWPSQICTSRTAPVSTGCRPARSGWTTGSAAASSAGRKLERSCQALFPGYRLDRLGGVRGIGPIWDAPRGSGNRRGLAGNGT